MAGQMRLRSCPLRFEGGETASPETVVKTRRNLFPLRDMIRFSVHGPDENKKKYFFS